MAREQRAKRALTSNFLEHADRGHWHPPAHRAPVFMIPKMAAIAAGDLYS
jgi:hypothetical protein